jgi:hypothetical protein
MTISEIGTTSISGSLPCMPMPIPAWATFKKAHEAILAETSVGDQIVIDGSLAVRASWQEHVTTYTSLFSNDVMTIPTKWHDTLSDPLYDVKIDAVRVAKPSP